MTPNEKLAFVKEQIDRIHREGVEREISCPYCMGVVEVNRPPCCGTLWRAVSAIMEAILMSDKLDTAQRIYERARNN